MYVLFLLGLFLIGAGISLSGFSLTLVILPAVHIFIFGAIAYMWKFLTAFHFSELEKYYQVFWGLGVLSVLIGLGVFVDVLPPVTGKIVAASMAPFGIVVGLLGYYSAYRFGGADGQKLAIFTTAGVDALLAGSLLNNLYQVGVIENSYLVILNNLLFLFLFLLAVFWGHLKGVKW